MEDLVGAQQVAGRFEHQVERAQRRARIARDHGGGGQPIALIELVAQHEQPHERLDAGQEGFLARPLDDLLDHPVLPPDGVGRPATAVVGNPTERTLTLATLPAGAGPGPGGHRVDRVSATTYARCWRPAEPLAGGRPQSRPSAAPSAATCAARNASVTRVFG